MAGTLVISNISDGTTSTSATNAIQGSAKAWVNFNGSTATVRASFNVSSVTRTTTGTYTINFTAAMSDANYSWVGTTNYNNIVSHQSTVAQSTTSLGIAVIGVNPNQSNDAAYVNTAVFR